MKEDDWPSFTASKLEKLIIIIFRQLRELSLWLHFQFNFFLTLIKMQFLTWYFGFYFTSVMALDPRVAPGQVDNSGSG